MKNFSLVEQIPIEIGQGDEREIIDWNFKTVAESDTLQGIIHYCRMKKLKYGEGGFVYVIQRNFHEMINGVRIPDDEVVGYWPPQ